MAKIAYRTGTTEQHLGVPRESGWAALLEALAGRGLADRLGPGSRSQLVSLEPPWRRVSSLEGGPARTERCEVTFTLRHDGDQCHLTWSYLVHPGAGDDALLEALDRVGHEVLDEVRDRIATAP